MRRHAALLLALLVLGAGCSNILPWSDPEPLPPTENAVEYPPGTNAEWISRPDRLLTARRAELDRSAYGLTTGSTDRSTGPEEWANSTLVIQHGTERTRIHETGTSSRCRAWVAVRAYRWAE